MGAWAALRHTALNASFYQQIIHHIFEIDSAFGALSSTNKSCIELVEVAEILNIM